jgi:hypothetical protein
LAPDTRASPRSGTPPWIASLSTPGPLIDDRRSIRPESGEKEAPVAYRPAAAQSSGV